MNDMVTTRTIEAPVSAVWHAWNTSDEVKQWWGPTGFTCPVAEMDVRVGGSSLVCMRAPQEYGGGDIYNTWTYTVVEPETKLEYVSHFTDEKRTKLDPAAMGMPAGIPAEVPHSVTFADKDGKTEVTVVEKGYGSPETAELSKQGMDQCLDKLEVALKAAV
jgi:uncharacterized protein YndB with AHSA1/START domain